MPRSLKVGHDYIDQVKVALIRNGYPNQTSLANDTGLALATVSKFLTGKPISHASFEELSHRLNLDWREISIPNAQSKSLSNDTYLFVKKKHILGCSN